MWQRALSGNGGGGSGGEVSPPLYFYYTGGKTYIVYIDENGTIQQVVKQSGTETIENDNVKLEFNITGLTLNITFKRKCWLWRTKATATYTECDAGDTSYTNFNYAAATSGQPFWIGGLGQ